MCEKAVVSKFQSVRARDGGAERFGLSLTLGRVAPYIVRWTKLASVITPRKTKIVIWKFVIRRYSVGLIQN